MATTYAEQLKIVKDHLAVLEALVNALPDPVSDLAAIDTGITGMIGRLQAQASNSTPTPR